LYNTPSSSSCAYADVEKPLYENSTAELTEGSAAEIASAIIESGKRIKDVSSLVEVQIDPMCQS
jgi:hypothetical protein